MTTSPATTTSPLDALFRPRSVAVVGATPDIGKPGGRCLRFLREFGFEGDIYGINPKYDEIDGIRCFPDLDSAPAGIDLVILIVPAQAVPTLVRTCGARGTRAAIACSSGFAETGPEGATLERKLAAAAAEAGVAVLGPNSLGLLDLNGALAATFSTALQMDVRLVAGPIALVSQSGAMGAAIFGLAQMEGIGVGTFVSTGNETVLGLSDYIRHFADAPDTRVVVGYLEGVRDGAELVAAGRYARERDTTVIVLKAGVTDAGAQAARSHTGALAGHAAVYEAAFRRAGILTASSPRELLDVALACASGRLPRGSGVGIASMSGGAGAIISDRLAQLGMDVAQLAAETRAAMASLMPGFAAVGNPVDYGGIYTDPDRIEELVRALAHDPGVDTLMCFIGLSPLMLGELDVRLERIRGEIDKPVVAAWLAGPPDGVRSLRERGVPAYEDPIRAANVVAAMRGAAQALRSEPEPEPPRPAGAAVATLPSGVLGERETKQLLAEYGVPVVQERLARTAKEATRAAAEFGVPVAVKAEADDLLHKSDAGAVKLDVVAADAAAAFEQVTAAAAASGASTVHGAVIQPMARGGAVELLVGTKWDPQFGPVVVAGLGGVASEALDDVAIELAPLTTEHALAMLDRLRGRAVLGAFRGRPARDRTAAAELIVAAGRLAADAGSALAELDCNPVLLYPEGEGCLVVDAAAVIQAQREG